jgi:hypothetical protein
MDTVTGTSSFVFLAASSISNSVWRIVMVASKDTSSGVTVMRAGKRDRPLHAVHGELTSRTVGRRVGIRRG